MRDALTRFPKPDIAKHRQALKCYEVQQERGMVLAAATVTLWCLAGVPTPQSHPRDCLAGNYLPPAPPESKGDYPAGFPSLNACKRGKALFQKKHPTADVDCVFRTIVLPPPQVPVKRYIP
jgi:hypothetical protein